MSKARRNPRILAVTALLVAAFFLFKIVGCGGGQTYTLLLDNASQLVNGNEIRVGGRRVGTVKNLRLDDSYRALADLEITDGDFTPLPSSTKATVRSPSLAGIANRYVALNLGPNSGPKLKEGGQIPIENVKSSVELDQLFNTFDPETQKQFTRLIDGAGKILDGSQTDLNSATKELAPFFDDSRKLVGQIASDQPALSEFVAQSAKVMSAVSDESQALTGLISGAKGTVTQLAGQSAQITSALQRMPGVLRNANTTFVNTRSTLDAVDPLVAAAKPATADLLPLLKELRPLVSDSRPTIASAKLLLQNPGIDNDLVELLKKNPQLQKVAVPVLSDSNRAAKTATPTVAFSRPYTPEFFGYLKDFSQSSAQYDANGHFARIGQMLSPSSLASVPALLPVMDSLNKMLGDGGLKEVLVPNIARCPGAGTQVRPDKSNNWRDEDGKLDCDPNLVVKGL